MARTGLVSLLIALCLLAGLAAPALADGIIIPPEPPICPGPHCPPNPMTQLNIKFHHVTVTIEDQIAVTRVDQVFSNPNDWPVEGTYIFPLPAGAVVSDFVLWVDGEPVKGEVLSAEQARAVYDEIVSSLRDPALLEYEGRGAVRASIFPIPPGGERRIELQYTQVLAAENGLVRYVYPLNTEKFSQEPLKDVSVRVEIRDRQPIRAVYSPSHPLSVDTVDDHFVKAGYEAKTVRPDSDFALYYSIGESEAFHLFSYRDPGDPVSADGFFMLLLAPRPGEGRETVAKDVLLVLDRSGSMEGEKFVQAQQAARYILSHLNPEDRFHLLSFSTGIDSFRPGLSPASDADEALGWVDGISAAGSTDINRALLESAAAMDRERPTYLIFLTDGLPTQGVTDSQQILDNFARSAPGSLRLFAFGVGYDVDTTLLDTLSQEHHGMSTYVRPGESISEILSAFYERISTPVLTDLALDFGGVSTYDVYPNPLPDLFSGSQIVVAGRYRAGGAASVTLTGQVNGQEQAFSYDDQLFAEDNAAEPGVMSQLPRLWATRKIGYLLNQVRLNGPDKETIDQIVQLSIRYGIVTPYTSYLVTEPMPLGAEQQEKIAGEALQNAQAAPAAPSGAGAVDRSAQEGALQSADAAPPTGGGEGEQRIRVVGARTFVLNEGVWTDTSFDPQQTPTEKVSFLSDAYRSLLRDRPELAPALALGSQVIVVSGGTAYQVFEEGAAVSTATPLPASTATAVPEPSATPRTAAQPAAQAPTPTPAASSPQPGPGPICGGLFIPAVVIGLVLVTRAVKSLEEIEDRD